MEDDLDATPDDTLIRLKRWFEQAEDATREARERSERDRDYYDGWQLTDDEIAQLKARGQPPVVINRIKPKIDWLRGLEAQRRTDPRAFPRTPQHEQDAEAATDAIKFVCDNQNFDAVASTTFENMLIEGFGGCEVTHRQTRKGVEIVITPLHWDRIFYDPHSRKADFSDARFLGYVVWMDTSEAKRRWPEAAEGIDHTVANLGETYDDRPDRFKWADRQRSRVRIVQMWYREGATWHWCIFSGESKLQSGPSPYVDGDGNSLCPMEIQSAYVDRENQRYGVARSMIDVQDEINRRRSKALHLLTMRQTLSERGAVDSVAAMKRELARPDGHVEVTPDMRFEILNTNDLSAGQFSLLQEAKNEIEGMAAASVLGGQEGASASGRAVLAKQQGAMVELAPIFDRFQMWKKRVYEQIWARVRQLWTEERWIRVTDDERNVRFVGLNQPVTLADQLREMPEQQALGMARQIGLVPGDPRLAMPVGIRNNVAELEVDIILDEGPDAPTLEGETFEALVQLASSGAVPIPPEMLVEVTPGLRRDAKDRLLQAMQAQQQQAAQQAQSEAAREDAKARAEIDADAAKALADQAQAMKYAAEAGATTAEAVMPMAG